MILNPNEMTRDERYKLAIGCVLPRPIAWVSSMDKEGRLNLAPFSYFTMVTPSPLTFVFCPGSLPEMGPDGQMVLGKKHTWRNIEEVPEFVINMTNEETAVAMNMTASLIPRGESEFDLAKVTPIPSKTIRVPRVAEAPISFECRLKQIVVVSDGIEGAAAIFGEVQCIHVRDDLYQNGRIIVEKYKPIGRLAGGGYARVTDTFELPWLSPTSPVMDTFGKPKQK